MNDMSERRATGKDYVLSGISGILILLAVGGIAGLMWSLIVHDHADGDLLLSSSLVLAYVLLAVAAWRRTVWTRRTPTAPTSLRDRRNRRLSHREVIMSRAAILGAPTVTAIGAWAGWWLWNVFATMALIMVFQVFVSPAHQRRQILIERR
jgi:predicted MFS family arabinose efflux permease